MVEWKDGGPGRRAPKAAEDLNGTQQTIANLAVWQYCRKSLWSQMGTRLLGFCQIAKNNFTSKKRPLMPIDSRKWAKNSVKARCA
jgi:hypothetical protein